MSNMSFPGGERLVSERMPRGYFDDMTAMLWRIGNYVVGDTLYNVPTPSEMTTSLISVGSHALTLGFTFRHNDTTGTSEPIIYSGTVIEQEPYEQMEDALLCKWRQFILDTRSRRKTFSKGISIAFDGGEIVLQEGHPTGKRCAKGPKAWQQVSRLDKVCTRDDYDTFMSGLFVVYDGLLLQNTENPDEEEF